MLRADAIRPHDLLIIGAAAILLAFGLTWMRPGAGLQISVGLVVLILAVTSTRAALYLLIVSMLLSPEFAVGRLEGYGLGGRAISVRFDDLLLLVIGFTWLVKMAVYRELGVIRRTPLNRPIGLYIGVCMVATLLGVMAGRVQIGSGMLVVVKYIEYFLVFFVVANNVETKEQSTHLIIALLGTALVVSLYAISQIPGGARATAPFEGEAGEPNTLGGYLVFTMGLTIGLLVQAERTWVRTGLVVLLALMTAALLATLSRTSFVAGGVLLLAAAVMHWRRPAVLAMVLLVCLGLPLMAPANVKQRMAETVTGPRVGTEVRIGRVAVDASTSERLRSWALVWEDWKKQPLLGHGVTGYAWTDAQYVKILGETGLAGLAAFFWLMASLWTRVRAMARTEEDPVGRGLANGFLLGMVAVLVHAIGANSFIIIRIMEPFWLCAGLAVAWSTITERMTARSPVQSSA